MNEYEILDIFNNLEENIEDLTFKKFRKANIEMTKECFPMSLDWNESDWMLALVGEVGELANFLKKRKRGEKVNPKDIEYEFADILFYLDKLANYEEVDLEQAAIEKYNIVAKDRGSDLKL